MKLALVASEVNFPPFKTLIVNYAGDIYLRCLTSLCLCEGARARARARRIFLRCVPLSLRREINACACTKHIYEGI